MPTQIKKHNRQVARIMKEEEYLTDRLENQINWYDHKSQFNQKWCKRLRMIEIVCASLIPLLSGLSGSIAYSEWIIGILGVAIAMAAAAGGLYKFQENWIQYRTSAETLKHEKYLYITNSTPYSGNDKFEMLVTRIESLISKENSNWSRYVKQKDERKPA
ncbi:MAG: DUF4231 domain-containing protein [Gammaproteobacteria bacterium]|nr:DUF4231 domain-containing protein [Gammaproteobacteria bacterium]